MLAPLFMKESSLLNAYEDVLSGTASKVSGLDCVRETWLVGERHKDKLLRMESNGLSHKRSRSFLLFQTF